MLQFDFECETVAGSSGGESLFLVFHASIIGSADEELDAALETVEVDLDAALYALGRNADGSACTEEDAEEEAGKVVRVGDHLRSPSTPQNHELNLPVAEARRVFLEALRIRKAWSTVRWYGKKLARWTRKYEHFMCGNAD